MAKDGSSARDTRIAMSIVEIHGDSIQDLLSNDPYRRLDVKSVRARLRDPHPTTGSSLLRHRRARQEDELQMFACMHSS